MTLRNTMLAGSLALSGCPEETELSLSPSADCQAITDETKRRLESLNDNFECMTVNYYRSESGITHFGPTTVLNYKQDFTTYSDLSSVEGTSGDCSEVIKKNGEEIAQAYSQIICTNGKVAVADPLPF